LVSDSNHVASYFGTCSIKELKEIYPWLTEVPYNALEQKNQDWIQTKKTVFACRECLRNWYSNKCEQNDEKSCQHASRKDRTITQNQNLTHLTKQNSEGAASRHDKPDDTEKLRHCQPIKQDERTTK
jgi:hypothetical protein